MSWKFIAQGQHGYLLIWQQRPDCTMFTWSDGYLQISARGSPVDAFRCPKAWILA